MTLYTKSPAWENAQDIAEDLTTLIPNYNPVAPDEVKRIWRFHNQWGFFISTDFLNNAIDGDIVITLPEGETFDTDWYGITGEIGTHYPSIGWVNAVTNQGGGRYGIGTAFVFSPTELVLVVNGAPISPGNPGNWNNGGHFDVYVPGVIFTGDSPRENNPEIP